MAGVMPLIPLVGGFGITVVAEVDMSGGLRGKVPARDTVASIEATMVSMVGVCVGIADPSDSEESEVVGARNMLRDMGREGISTMMGAWYLGCWGSIVCQ